jgi:hypothetical protein
MKPNEFRIMRRNGEGPWLVKQSPGWHIVFRGVSLQACADWFLIFHRDVDLAAVAVPDGGWPWPNLKQRLEEHAPH